MSRTILPVAVVIPCRNEAATIGALLEALSRQTSPPDLVIVADDRSTDRTREVVEAWAAQHQASVLKVVPGPGRGAGAAMNAGIAAATSDIIVRLDGHCRPEPDYIARSVATLGPPGVAVVGGIWRIEPGSSTLVARGIAAVLSHPLGSGGAEYRAPPAAHGGEIKEVDTVPFGAFHKAVWTEVGGFDESLVRNQDYDFNYRVRLTGRKVLLNPAIVSVYKARSTYGTLARQYFDYGFWKVVMLRKFPRSLRGRQLLPMLLLPSLIALALWATAGRASAAVWLLAAYLTVDLAGACHASVKAGDWRLTPFALVALLVLQNAWSAGAWTSLLQGARGRRR